MDTTVVSEIHLGSSSIGHAFVNDELALNLYPPSKWEHVFQTWEKFDSIREQPLNRELEINL